MTQNLWVNARGKEYAVANHTLWLEKLFRAKLPPIEDVEHEIEKNRLYDWALRTNWLRARVDYNSRSLYVDPDPLTGDQWRWLARRGAADHLQIYNSDGKELANFQPGQRKKKKQHEGLAHRLKLGMGIEEYVREAIDVKKFIIDQPVFIIRRDGKRWMVGVNPPVAKGGMIVSAPVLGFLDELAHGLWLIHSLALPYEKIGRRLVGRIYNTKEAAAEALWKVIGPHLSEAAPESVRDWILNQKDPPAREMEYQVWAKGTLYGKFKTLEQAHRFVGQATGSVWVYAPYVEIRKVHLPTAAVMSRFRVTGNGGLIPITEAVDVKDFIVQQPEQRYWVKSDGRTYWGGPYKEGEDISQRIGGHWHASPLDVPTFSYDEAKAEVDRLVEVFGGTISNTELYGNETVWMVPVDEEVIVVAKKRRDASERKRRRRDYLKQFGEAVNPRDFIDKNAGEFLFVINEYVENTHDDRETRPLRVGYSTEIEQDEAKARRVAVAMAEKAGRRADAQSFYPNDKGVLRVELEHWDISAAYGEDAVLKHTYLVKADGTFEEISGPADASRVGIAR